MDSLIWAANSLSAHVSQLTGYLFDPNKRLYLDYLAGALVLALLVLFVQQIRMPTKPTRIGAVVLLKRLFSRQYLWHPSARLDYQLFVINPLLTGAVSGLLVISAIPVALSVSNALDAQVGSVSPGWPAWLVTALYTLTLFIADDFTRYLLHRLMHRIPWLWSIHRLHHSATVLTPVTVFRIHPLESLLYANRMFLTQGVVLGVFFFAFGMRLSAWDIAGANAFTYLFNLLGANLRHSHIRLSYGLRLEKWLISPAQHQLHHSNRREHANRNFGAFLAIWDRLGGTLTCSPGEQIDGFGVGNGSDHHANLAQAYWEPLRSAATAGFRRPTTPQRLSHPTTPKKL